MKSVLVPIVILAGAVLVACGSVQSGGTDAARHGGTTGAAGAGGSTGSAGSTGIGGSAGTSGGAGGSGNAGTNGGRGGGGGSGGGAGTSGTGSAGRGGTTGAAGTGGATGSGGAAGRQCKPNAVGITCSTICELTACCGSTCCNTGEWCDTSGTAPVCRCSSNNACPTGQMCAAPGPVDVNNPCGVVCCSGSGCPMSRRVFKRDIETLTSRDLDRVYGELRELRLTTYQYKSEPPSSPRHLGFIIDDTKTPYPINPDGNSVDLYGYMSMAVAAIQVQSREIEALRAEVTRLRRRSVRR